MRTSLVLVALIACNGKELEPCYADDVPVGVTLRYGWQDDGTFVAPGGRRVLPAGPNTILPGMPVDVAIHPDGTVAYVVITSRNLRRLAVIDLDTLQERQVVSRSNAAFGLELDAAGTRLYSVGGARDTVDFFDIAGDGTLTEVASVDVGATTSGLALSPDGATVWAGTYSDGIVAEIDVATEAVTRTFDLSGDAWDVVYVPGRHELYVSDLQSGDISVLDLTIGEEVATIEVVTAPAGLAVSPDGARVFAAVSNGDVVVAIDTATRSIAVEGSVVEDDGLVDSDGVALGNSNITAVWLDATGTRLYATRGSDNAVTILDAATLAHLGAFPVAMYPTDVEEGPDGRVVVVEWKGGGIADDEVTGSLTVVDPDDLDLDLTTAEVSDLMTSATDAWPFACDDGFFPIPSRQGQESPIEHVVLVVKENKTLDCLFGDMGGELDLAVDPEFQRWPAQLTPNQRALMRTFATSDNFYVDARESDSGHVMLTSAHMTHWVEWMWVETSYSGGPASWPLADQAQPRVGNFFTHLIDNGRSIRVYGEIVGMFAEAQGGLRPMDFSDTSYPGGAIVNYAVTDEEKARYVVNAVRFDGLPDFLFVSLPNDHTVGTVEGMPTPESMVADNDVAVGILVEGLSADPEVWEKTAVFILQDDPQGCGDHVNDSRSPLTVVSPWAKRGGYVSHVNADFLSVFATIERILDVPPMARPDATAMPLWDMFQPEADLTPFVALPRVSPEFNKKAAFGAEESLKMDFSGPDRSPELGPLLDAYMQWRMGRITREEAELRLIAPRMGWDDELWEEVAEEAEEEIYAFDLDFARYVAWCEARGLPAPERPEVHPPR